MRPRTKICGLTRPEDARLARELGADFFGVIFFEKSPRHVPASVLPRMLAAIPDGKRVAVDVAPAPGKLKQYDTLGFNYFQVHFDPKDVTLAQLNGWKNEVGAERLWLAPRLPLGVEFPAQALEVAQTLLLDTYQEGTFGGTGRTGDWSHYRSLAESHPKHHWVLSGGLRPENIRAALRATGAKMVDVNSGVESAPGVKDAVLLDLLFANLSSD
ncbi:MAG TPA: phosphoribosylanthranilate isomerase [Opitutales bacterium]|jgi:phosphoribosylanthranilate isomerase|nr:phosphoribosylanthranilate isomerase [Opitutales bacterium]